MCNRAYGCKRYFGDWYSVCGRLGLDTLESLALVDLMVQLWGVQLPEAAGGHERQTRSDCRGIPEPKRFVTHVRRRTALNVDSTMRDLRRCRQRSRDVLALSRERASGGRTRRGGLMPLLRRLTPRTVAGFLARSAAFSRIESPTRQRSQSAARKSQAYPCGLATNFRAFPH